MAFTQDQLNKLQTEASKYWWVNAIPFQEAVNKQYWAWTYDKIINQFNNQTTPVSITNTQTTPSTVVDAWTTTTQPTKTPWTTTTQPTTTQNNFETEKNKAYDEYSKAISLTDAEKQQQADLSKVQTVEQWKQETWWWIQNLQSWIDSRYWTMSNIEWNKLKATINWEQFEWSLDNQWNPIRTSLWKAKTPEQVQIETDQNRQRVMWDFEKLLNTSPTEDAIMNYVNQNKQFAEDFKWQLTTYFKSKANADFFRKYWTYTEKELLNAYQQGKIIIWDEKYNLLPQELRTNFEKLLRAEQLKATWWAFSFEDMNWNVVNMSDILKEVNNMFSTNIRKEYEDKINSPKMSKLKEDMSAKSTEIWNLDNTIKNLEDDLRAKYPWISEWRLQALLRRDQKELYRKRDDLVVQYNSVAQQYSMNKEEIQYWVELAKYEDSIARDNFKTALTIYQTERARMDEKEKQKFTAAQSKLTADRAFQEKIALLDYENQYRMNEWKFIERDEWIYFAKNDWSMTLVSNGWIKTNSDGGSTYSYVDESWMLRSVYKDVTGKIVNPTTENTTLNQKQVDLISSVKWSIIPSKYWTTYNSNWWMQCWEYVNSLAWLKMWDSYDSKLAVANSKTWWVWDVAVWQVKPNDPKWSQYWHTGVIVWDEWDNWIIKSSNINWDGKISVDRVPKTVVDWYANTNLMWVSWPNYNDAQKKFLETVDVKDYSSNKNIKDTAKNLWLKETDIYSFKAKTIDPKSKQEYQNIIDSIQRVYNAWDWDWLSDALWSFEWIGWWPFGWARRTDDQWNIYFQPWSDAADFAREVESLKSILTLPNLNKMTWTLTDKDISVLRGAATSLDYSMSESAFKNELNRIKETYAKLLWQTKIYDYVNERWDWYTKSEIQELDVLVKQWKLKKADVDYWKKLNDIK